MRALKSYGTATILILLVAIWFSTGLLVRGGNGPDDSEQTVVSFLEKDGGPITDAVQSSGIARQEHHLDGAKNPALSIAERNILTAQTEGIRRVVRIKTFIMQPMKLEVTLRGHTKAKASLSAAVQTSEIVESISVREGQRVAEGDLICTLRSGTRQASVDQARAAVKQAQATLAKVQTDFNTNLALRDRGLVSGNSGETAAANLLAAESGLEAVQVALSNRIEELDKTEIRAGLSGVIQGPIVEIGTLLSFGGSCAKIIQLDPMVFVGTIPQVKINFAKTGMPAKIKTINGLTAAGKVTFISVSADQATRTFPFEIEFANPGAKVLDGLTAEAIVNMGTIAAHLLPQSVLTLDSDGALGIKVVEDDTVVFYPIEILRDTRDGIWAAGLPVTINAIIVGQEYVSRGQKVDAQFAD